MGEVEVVRCGGGGDGGGMGWWWGGWGFVEGGLDMKINFSEEIK